jgi:uracil-DNA glycosylase
MRGREYWVNALGEGWAMQLRPLLKDPSMDSLMDKLAMEYAMNKVYPSNQATVFDALKLCPWDKLQIVIIGTEPNTLSGVGALAYSDIMFTAMNPAVCQIRNCLERQNKTLLLDFDTTMVEWAERGVLLLNRSLTCRVGEPKSHRDLWKQFFGAVMYNILKYKPETPIVLWGKEAQLYSELLSEDHAVFSWEHPMKANSEYRNWECPNFEQIDKYRISIGKEKFRW